MRPGTSIGKGGKNMATEQKTNQVAAVFEKPVGKDRKLGLVISLALSAILFILALPFVNWIRLTPNLISELLATLKVNIKEVEIYPAYSMLLFLGFVQNSKAGILGFPAFGVFLLVAASIIVQGIYIVMLIINKPTKNNGYLGVYSRGKGANILSLLASIGTILYVTLWANKKTYPNSFQATIPTWITLVLSIVNIVIIKVMEAKERKIYHEHGLLVELKRNWVLFIFLIPCFVYYLINNYLPMVGVYFGFTQFNFREGLFFSPFVGFSNFTFLFKGELLKLIKNTILYNIVFISVGNILQIFFAILVSQVGIKWYKRTSQTLIFMPYFVSFVILKVLVYSLFEYKTGLINSLGAKIGADPIDFYNQPKYWPFLITAFHLWKGIGYGMVVYLATIMGISEEFYDAAKVDGANIFQQIMYVTVPQLKPTFIILLLYAIGGIMKGQFELFWQMVGTNGMLFKTTDILDTYIYRITTQQPLSMGYGTAAGLFQSLFGLIVVLLTNWLIKRKNEEYALF